MKTSVRVYISSLEVLWIAICWAYYNVWKIINIFNIFYSLFKDVLFFNRACDNPAPSGGGANCAGSSQDSMSCTVMNYCIPSVYGNINQVFSLTSGDLRSSSVIVLHQSPPKARVPQTHYNLILWQSFLVSIATLSLPCGSFQISVFWIS